MLKGPKRSFVVVAVVLGGVESWAKTSQIKQEMFANKNAHSGTKKVTEWMWDYYGTVQAWINFVAQWEQSFIFCGKLLKLWHWIAVFDLNGLVWPCFVWSCCFYGNRHVWPCVVLHGLFMVFYSKISSFLAVIDPNSFGLVFT